MADDLGRVDGLHWQESGQTVLSEAPLALARRIDEMFRRWATSAGAFEYRVPIFISARELHRLDYFHSFPHLVMFPVALDPAPEILKEYAMTQPLDEEGAVRLGKCSPVRDVLTPAACYHFYVLLQDSTLQAARTLTTAATCFRREAYYRPLQRQSNFTMREIVRLGTLDEVKGFLADFRQRLEPFFSEIGLPISWRAATDSFFDPSHDPKFLAQTIEPVKTEMVFGDDLAIGSINFHRNFFGETFGIRRNGEAAFSGCVAFGIERWVFAFLSRFGPAESGWPELP